MKIAPDPSMLRERRFGEVGRIAADVGYDSSGTRSSASGPPPADRRGANQAGPSPSSPAMNAAASLTPSTWLAYGSSCSIDRASS